MQTTERAEVRAKCWSCGAELAVGQPFCPDCGKVQRPAEVNYFAFFGLPRRLNLDPAALEKQFYRYSRKLHPDLHARAAEEEQQWSLAQASLVNDAYRTLRDPIERTRYLLTLEGVQLKDDREQRQGASNPSKVPADLLEEVFELNMQLEELRMNRKMGTEDLSLRRDLKRTKSEFEAQLGALDEEIRARGSAWDQACEQDDEAAKTKSKDAMTALLQRRSYLRNLVDDVNETLGES